MTQKDDQMIQALQKRGGIPRGVLIGGGALLALALAAAVVVSVLGGGAGDKEFGALSRCLIGEPLAEGENVFFRLREVQQAEGLRELPPEQAWPHRCAPHATALYRSIDGSGNSALLARLLRSELSCSDDEATSCAFPKQGHPLGKADEIWKAADIAGLTAAPAPEVEAPPSRLAPVTQRDLPSLGAASYQLSDIRIADGGGESWLVFRSTDRTAAAPLRFCRLTDKGAKASCSDVKTPRVSSAVRFVDGDKPPAVSGAFDTGDDEVIDALSLSDGRPLELRGGLRNGYLLERRGNDMFLVAVKAGAATAQEKLPFDSDTDATVVESQLGWFETKDEERQLSFRSIGPDAKLSGEPVTLEGKVPFRVDVCRGPDGSALAYGRTPARHTVWFFAEGKWSKPVVGEHGGTRVNEWGAFCSKNRLTRTFVEKQGEQFRIGRLDCTPGGCKRQVADWKEGRVKRFLAVATLGDDTAVLYESFAGGIRLRQAALAELGKTTPVLLMDSFEFSGEKLEDPRVVIAPDHVAVVFNDEEQLHALYANAESHGAVAPE